MWQGFRQTSMASWPATTDVRDPVAQWAMCLTTNQKIAGSGPDRINRFLCGKDLERLVWQADRLQLMSEVLCCNGQCLWLRIRRLLVQLTHLLYSYSIHSIPLSLAPPLLQPPFSPLLSHPQVHSKNLQKSKRYINSWQVHKTHNQPLKQTQQQQL